MIYTGWNLFHLFLFCALCDRCSAFWPFPLFAATDFGAVQGESARGDIKRIAIIGAGAAGASTAFHLQKFAAASGVPIEITVFERSSHVGGRSTTVNAYNSSTHPVELGASIFVEVNTILKNATEQFGLKIRESESEEAETLGIWNGKEFVYTQKGDSWWNLAKLFWKYGLAPYRTQKLMKSTVGKFQKLYETPFFPFRSLSDRALDLELIAVTSITGEQLLKANDIGPPFTTEIIQASTRVNYGQNLNLIHGLETMVCMAIEGAMQIDGGNWQIFAGMLNASSATVQLEKTVTAISKHKEKFQVDTVTKGAGLDINADSALFDSVVMTGPFQYSDIEIEKGLLRYTPDKIPYVTLHVTLFTSTSRLNPIYFNLAPDGEVPTTILTTLSPDETTPSPEDGVGSSGFFSISTLRTLVNPKTLQKEYLYKIFSPQAITSEFLSHILAATIPDDLSSIRIDSGNISWYYPHIWKSYPYEYPRVTFDELELARGFYYTGGIESFISTMETSALMGMNIAQLAVDDYLQVLQTDAGEVDDFSQKKMKLDIEISQTDEL